VYNALQASLGDFNLPEQLAMAKMLNEVKDNLLTYHSVMVTPLHYKPRIGRDDPDESYGWRRHRLSPSDDRLEILVTKVNGTQFKLTYQLDWSPEMLALDEEAQALHKAKYVTGFVVYPHEESSLKKLVAEAIGYLLKGELPADLQPL
jgi:hypothetical protein